MAKKSNERELMCDCDVCGAGYRGDGYLFGTLILCRKCEDAMQETLLEIQTGVTVIIPHKKFRAIPGIKKEQKLLALLWKRFDTHRGKRALSIRQKLLAGIAKAVGGSKLQSHSNITTVK